MIQCPQNLVPQNPSATIPLVTSLALSREHRCGYCDLGPHPFPLPQRPPIHTPNKPVEIEFELASFYMNATRGMNVKEVIY